jgi:eukaryotic-like serine/threonine-protein kinase
MSLARGARLGPYEIIDSLGSGGMGEVYRARDTRLDRTVAIKILPAALAAEPQLRERFEREARAISSLNHPHICALYDVGHQAPSTDATQAIDFLVLEYLEGETLADRLTRTGRLAPADALRAAIEICSALDRAHRSGIVHRDLKPGNVFLVRSGGASAPPVTKLLDFGLAKTAAPVVAATSLSMLPTTPPTLTSQGTILGTFQYMAPEQIEGLEADPRTDIFAFGTLLFEMLTGRPPFEGKTRASLLGAILKDDPPRVSAVQPDVPRSLDRIVSTCLAKDADERYQSARDLLRDLKWVAADAAESVGRVPVSEPRRSSALAWSAVAAAVLVAIATALWAWGARAPRLRRQPAPHCSRSPPPTTRRSAVRSAAEPAARRNSPSHLMDAMSYSWRDRSRSISSGCGRSPALPPHRFPGRKGRPSRSGRQTVVSLASLPTAS